MSEKTVCKMNDETLQNVSGGNTDDSAGELTHKYQAQQKVLFQNPNDPSEELTGLIRAISTELGDDGYPYYIILVTSSEQEAELMIGRNYRVSEKYVLMIVS